ncbi:MAG: radical SAM protein [Deltaproteobacteria bacterium]|nr:radical SAM protein [Deltaproteobacteria bacterium]
MKVLIIAANRNQHPVPVVPYGACMVAEAAAVAGHQVRFLDLMFQSDPKVALSASLDKFPADVIGLSVRNLDNNDMQHPAEFISQLTEITQAIQRCSPAPLILGGPAVGLMPEPLLRRTKADAAILGDGERIFPSLLRSLNNGGGFQQVPRLAWLEDGRYRESAANFSPISSSCSTPDFPHWLDLRAYAANLASMPLQSKRGCPFSCVYCTYGHGEGREYRLLPPEEVAAAVQRLSIMGCRDIEFVDNVFNSPYSHALEICQHLARHRLPVRFQTLELNPAFIDDQLLEAMEQAGFIGVGVTVESAADPALAGLKKGYTADQVEQAAAAIRRSPLPCFWMFMLGGPGETTATVRESLRFTQRTLRPGDVAYFNVGIRIYPGTELEAIARAQGILNCSMEEMLDPVFYFSPELDYDWTLDQVRRAAAGHLNLLHAASLSHPWLPMVNRLFSRLPVSRPLWRHSSAIRRVVRALGKDI